MNIRTYRPGDEAEQVPIYNEAAAGLPKFKPATVEEIRRRCQARDFDPTTRFFAEEAGRIVGYASFHLNGRVSYPWARQGFEQVSQPLFDQVIQAMRSRGINRAFAAYRGDWPSITAFFEKSGFHRAREMVSFVLDFVDLPTLTGKTSLPRASLRKEDLPAIRDLIPGLLRITDPAQLERYFFNNPYFAPEALVVLRSRTTGAAAAVSILIDDPVYTDPKQTDAAMPCFRLGAFGTEGMQPKRVKGLFSFVAPPDRNLPQLGMDLLGHAVSRLDESDATCLAAQVPSDAPHLLRFYESHFRKQGSFPVYERAL